MPFSADIITVIAFGLVQIGLLLKASFKTGETTEWIRATSVRIDKLELVTGDLTEDVSKLKGEHAAFHRIDFN